MSKDIERCDTCMGRKSITGLGGMTKSCPVCHGIGWLTKKNEPEQKQKIK